MPATITVSILLYVEKKNRDSGNSQSKKFDAYILRKEIFQNFTELFHFITFKVSEVFAINTL